MITLSLQILTARSTVRRMSIELLQYKPPPPKFRVQEVIIIFILVPTNYQALKGLARV